jgi:hypothetical protein
VRARSLEDTAFSDRLARAIADLLEVSVSGAFAEPYVRNSLVAGWPRASSGPVLHLLRDLPRSF